MRHALATRLSRLGDALQLTLDEQKILRREQVDLALQRQKPLLRRPALQVQQPRRDSFRVQPFARLEHQVRLRMDTIRKGVVAALLIDPRGMAVLEVRRGHGGRRREDPLVEHVVQHAVAHRDALSLLAMACAQPEQREVHAMRDRVILGTQRDEPVTARHAPARG